MPRSMFAGAPSLRNPDMATVSIVIPTYNHADFLKSAIRSVLDQTLMDWEAIVVNNHSEDDTEQVVDSFNDDRIRLVNFRNHGVIAASRNHGIRLAKGDYIAFLDSDDVWYPEKLSRCMAKLCDGYDAVCHAELWTKEGWSRKVQYGPERRTTYQSLLYDGNCLSTSAIVVKRTALDRTGGFDEDRGMVTAEDYELWLRLARSGSRIGLIDDILGEYRLHDGNQSKAVMRNHQAELAVLRKHFAENMERGRFRWREKRRLAISYYGAARGMQAEGGHADAMRLLLRSWMAYPFIPKQYVAACIGLAHCLKLR